MGPPLSVSSVSHELGPAIEMGADDPSAAWRAQLDLARPERQAVLERARGGAGVGHRHLDAVHSLEHV